MRNRTHKEVEDMETKEIVISSRVHLSNRLGEAGRQVREWLKELEEPVDHSVDKLQFQKCEKRHDRYVYRYGIIRNRPSLALEAERETNPGDDVIFEAPFAYLENSPEAIF
jgi:hypothetical protein